MRETVDEMVSQAADHLTSAAGDAGRRMQARATQAAKDVAWETAKTFTSRLSGEDERGSSEGAGSKDGDGNGRS
jgi:hypothetical protein